MIVTDDERGSEVTMARYTFEYMVSEAGQWTRSRQWFLDRAAAEAEADAWQRMFMRDAKDTLIRVVRVDE
jgi:hypothetical protein